MLTNQYIEDIVRDFFIKKLKGNIGILKKNHISMKVKAKRIRTRKKETFSMMLFVWQII